MRTVYRDGFTCWRNFAHVRVPDSRVLVREESMIGISFITATMSIRMMMRIIESIGGGGGGGRDER